MVSRKSISKPYSILFVEGDTEVIFYRRMKNEICPGINATIKNLGGLWDINKKVLDKSTTILEAHPDKQFRVEICIDRESRSGKSQIDIEIIRKELNQYGNMIHNGVFLCEAVQDIESWFFHDIEGIYRHLRIPLRKLKKSTYKPVEKLNHRVLGKLFKSAGKDYRKGHASQNFIDHLDLRKIIDNCTPLAELIARIQ